MSKSVTRENSPSSAGVGAGDRWVRPLPLDLDAQVVADLGESDIRGPMSNEPAQHHKRIGLQVGAQQALRLEGAVQSAHQNPVDRNLLAGVVPQGRAGSDVQLALLAVIPAGDPDALPSGDGAHTGKRKR